MANKILVIDDTKVDLTEKKSSQANDATQYMTPAQIVTEGGGGSGYTYTEVVVTDTEIKTMGSSPVTLLAAPGANKYYEYYGFIEYTAGATAYTFANDNIIIGDDDTYAGDYIALNLINSTIDHTAGFNSFAKGQELGYAGGPHVGYPVKINKALKLFTYNATDPTLGDGTFLVKIWYKVKTFGTEL